jgi:hypothetical protein
MTAARAEELFEAGISARVTLDDGLVVAQIGNAGDIDGDGGDELCVSGWLDDASVARIYTRQGGAPTLGWELEGTCAPDVSYGVSRPGVGDIDGDGFGDLALGYSV